MPRSARFRKAGGHSGYQGKKLGIDGKRSTADGRPSLLPQGLIMAILTSMNTRAHYGFDLLTAALALAVTAVTLIALTAVVAISAVGLWWLIPLA